MDGFSAIYFNQTRGSGSGTLQLSSVAINRNTVPLTVTASHIRCSKQGAAIAHTVCRRITLRHSKKLKRRKKLKRPRISIRP
jgi:hypothetical protein